MPVIQQSLQAVQKVVSALNKGGVIIVPTDTVYGFLADATNKKAVEKIYKIKKRPRSKPLPLFVAHLSMAKEIGEADDWEKIKKYWPGPYTFVIKRKTGIKLYGVKKETIALRIPKHPFLQKVLKKFGRPVAQTSVNISGKETINNIEKIKKTFGNHKEIFIIDGGNLRSSKPSKIYDLTRKHLTKIR